MTTATLVAGRALDAMVAEKVMGWQFVPASKPEGHPRWTDGEDWFCAEKTCISGGSPPAYSTDIAAAWQVVEELHRRFPDLTIEVGWSHETRQWFCQDYDEMNFGGAGSSAPLAICLAALRAVDG